jgi:hypothetical protein
MVYRRRLRPELVRTAGRMAVGGLVLMLGSVAGGVLLALDVVLPRRGAIAVVVGVVVWFSVFWYVVPFELRRRGPAVRASSDESAASNRR